MTAKKWLLAFALTALSLALLLGLFNILTDSFGVFGDPIMDWWSYNMTNNPRAAKMTWLMEHFDEYDSYIVGCSSTSSFSVETLNEYTGANFYNLIMYGADMLDCEQTIAYLLEHDEVKNIWLNVYLDNGMEYDVESNEYTHSMLPAVDGSSSVRFYSRFLFLNPEYGVSKIENYFDDTWLAQSFDVFDVKTGTYDKKKRDIEPISDIKSYLEAYPIFVNYPSGSGYTLPKTEECMASISRIKLMCEEYGAELTVVTAPVYAEYLAYFDYNDVAQFYKSLAEVTSFWDFSISSVSFEPRYFYDSTHFRNAVGDMAIARIFGDECKYIPDDFGKQVTVQNADSVFAEKNVTGPLAENEISAEIPILMYHHIADEVNDVTVTPRTFEEQMIALVEAGYTSVSLAELYDYVMGQGSLPEKPVLITFDDGYASNYETAYPILEQYGMKAVIFVIGSSVGKDTYKDINMPIIPHFDESAMLEMVKSGVIEIGSHTYDLHQSAEYEISRSRIDMDRFDGEDEGAYLRVVREDVRKSLEQLESATGEEIIALAYPRGVMTDEAAAVLREEGIKLTFSTTEGVQTVVRGLEQSLYGMKRFNIGGEISAEEFLKKLG